MTMSHSPEALLDALLRTTTDAIIPLTADGVRSGCKVFGAAILRKSDLGLVNAATNHETASPLLHGEINCIQQFYSLADHPSPKDCVFFATHEPCSLCTSPCGQAYGRSFGHHVVGIRQLLLPLHV